MNWGSPMGHITTGFTVWSSKWCAHQIQTVGWTSLWIFAFFFLWSALRCSINADIFVLLLNIHCLFWAIVVMINPFAFCHLLWLLYHQMYILWFLHNLLFEWHKELLISMHFDWILVNFICWFWIFAFFLFLWSTLRVVLVFAFCCHPRCCLHFIYELYLCLIT